jgi:hypothetical protein
MPFMIQKIKKTINIVLYLSLIYSCTEKSMNINVIKVNPNLAKQVLLSSIIDSISCIQLETNDECLIGYISILKYYNNRYYAYDHLSKTIFIFDKTGRFINKICKYGQSSNEYLGVDNFIIDNDNNLHVLDFRLKRILVYDTLNKVIKKINLAPDDCPRDFTFLGDNKYLLYMRDDYVSRRGTFIFDSDKKIYTKIIDNSKWDKETAFLFQYIIERNNYTYTLIDNYSSTVYNITEQKIANELTFDIKGKYNTASQTGYNFYSFYDSDNIIMLCWVYLDGRDNGQFINKEHLTCFYDRNTKEMKLFNKIQNDVSKEDVFYEGSMWVANDQIIFTVEGGLDEMGFEQNPMLRIWHLKQFNDIGNHEK